MQSDPSERASARERPLERADAEGIARTLRVLADPTRLQMLSIIAATEAGEVTVGELADATGFRQPTITHHASILVDDGVLVRSARGRQVWLSIAPDRSTAIRDLLR
jgi:ArsR family transcriptional regulator